MAEPTNVTEEGSPADLSGAATDEFGGPDIAADDAGGSALGVNTGRTSGGQESFGAGSEGGEAADDPHGAGEIAADDAGAAAAAANRVRQAEHRGD